MVLQESGVGTGGENGSDLPFLFDFLFRFLFWIFLRDFFLDSGFWFCRKVGLARVGRMVVIFLTSPCILDSWVG